MSCEIEKAIDTLLKYDGTSARIKSIINNSLKYEKQFNEVVKVEQTHGNYSKYLKEFTRYIKAKTGADIHKSIEFVKDFVNSKVSKPLFRRGEYDKFTDKITIADPNEVYSSIKVIETQLNESKLTEEERYKLNTTLDKLKSFKSETIVVHELVHAASLWTLTNNPDSEASQRVGELFEYLLKNHPDMATNKYWKANTAEFLAEALSNPEIIEYLMSVKLNKPIGKLTTLYDTLLSILLQSLGFKGKDLDSAFDVLLDSTMTMLENRNEAEQSLAKQKPSPEAQKQPSKPQTQVEGKSTSEKVAKPSASSESDSAEINKSNVKNKLNIPIVLDKVPILNNNHIENTLGEVYDVTAIFEKLGITVPNKDTTRFSVSDVLDFQTNVLDLINNNSLTKESLQKLADNTPWLLNSNSQQVAFHKQDRIKRSSSKNGKRYGKEGNPTEADELKYLTYQLIEEANEVIEASGNIDANIRDLLSKQKAILKVTRFGASTKIKAKNSTTDNIVYEQDKNGNPLTNITRVNELFNANISVDNIPEILINLHNKIVGNNTQDLTTQSSADNSIPFDKDFLEGIKDDLPDKAVINEDTAKIRTNEEQLAANNKKLDEAAKKLSESNIAAVRNVVNSVKKAQEGCN